MSSFFTFAANGKAQVLTDGAWLHPDGRLLAVDKKVFAFPNHPVAIVGRGTSATEVAEIIAHLVELSRTKANWSVERMLDGVRMLFVLLSDRGEFKADFLIAAWTPKGGPQHFYVPCCGEREGFPLFELTQIEPGLQMSSPAILPEELAHLGITAEDVAEPDFLERHGAEIMRAMRSKRDRIPGSDVDMFLVGGRCDLTTVSATGVSTKTLCTFDDVVGELIDPAVRATLCS
ncbi:hypothetical protein [Rhizobium mesoamericanum]|uniref:hypothetical protein n=1 Tax=Rhizobium mesoamericanum TaxID=1079800 RepID=UPI0003FB15EE|nr:hypothetical protein [Rhizobium mesoamericanum]